MKPGVSPDRAARGLLAGLKIRKKLIVLHTSFSLGLAAMILVALSPAMSKLIDGAEQDLALLVYRGAVDGPGAEGNPVRAREGSAEELGLSESLAERVLASEEGWAPLLGDSYGAGIVAIGEGAGRFVEVRTRSSRARDKARVIYILLIVTLLAGYALVAIALELFVLPQHVYSPIRALLDADEAVRRRDASNELVPGERIPRDELGEIMRSRNETVRQLRDHQRELAGALSRLESVAVDLHKKNKLLEAARRNLEGADRLASLGMMSAGIAHELNTPLAVVKGLVEKLGDRGSLSDTESALLVRVVGRIEKLSEGLLDFARVRTPEMRPERVASIVDEAWGLLRLDRQTIDPSGSLSFENAVDPGLVVPCDHDRMVQVFVNLIRNAVHAVERRDAVASEIVVRSRREERDGACWAVVSVQDSGPGIDPTMIDSLFEPFVSTRLDAKGTGLGLAVSDGIVREHGGFMVPSNRMENGERRGACFDVFVPVAPRDDRASKPEPEPAPEGDRGR